MDLATFQALPKAEREARFRKLSPQKQEAYHAEVLKRREIKRRNKFHFMFPDEGPLRRELYHHHVQFFADGAWAQASAFIGGNSTGKSQGGGFELTCHLTGLYPHWWVGKRFDRAIDAWCAGDTSETIRDILQVALLGVHDYRDKEMGTGIIPADLLGRIKPAEGHSGLISMIRIKHVSGRWSTLAFKSYEQGRKSFQGTSIHFIWLDEQCPTDIFEECLSRHRGDADDGRTILTFTGLLGATDVTLLFLPELSNMTTLERMRAESRSRVVCPMDDVPHLTREWIDKKLANYSGAARETRRTGIPYTGSGRIYKIEESVFVVEPFLVPKYWARVWAADFGFGSAEKGAGTACIWAAWDRENDIAYIYAEYFQAEMPRSVHAAAIKARGAWIAGVGDPAGKADDGKTTMQAYRDLGLDIAPASKAIEAGIDAVTERLSQGRLKVFSTNQRWIGEYRLYQYAPNGTIRKERDHLMDCTKMLVLSGLQRARVQTPEKQESYQSADFGL